MRRRSPEPITSAINRLVGELIPASEIAEIAVLWPEAVGELLAQETQPRSFKDGRLQIACSSSIWANELTLMAEQICQQLNALIGEKKIQQINFNVASFEAKK